MRTTADSALDDALRASGLLGPAEAAAFVRRGHHRYESGLHGDTLLDLDLLFADPRRVRAAATRLAARLAPHAPDAVCAPYAGGALVGLLVAEALDVAFVPAFPAGRGKDGHARYRLSAGAAPLLRDRRIAVVDDAINAGSATFACVRAVAERGGAAVVAGAFFARTPGAAEVFAAHGLPLAALVGLPFAAWEPDACPLCRAGVPLDAPP